MSSEKKPDPIEDVREGLGLLFRAAKNAVKELPTDKLEESLKTGVREVSKAVESVASTIEREVFGAKKSGGETAAPAQAHQDETVAPEDARPTQAQASATAPPKAPSDEAGEPKATAPSPSPSPSPSPAPAPLGSDVDQGVDRDGGPAGRGET